MSEQVNIEIAQKQIAALNARNIDEYLSRIDESYVGESESPLSRGRDGVRKVLGVLFGAFPDLRLENLCEWRFRCRPLPCHGYPKRKLPWNCRHQQTGQLPRV